MKIDVEIDDGIIHQIVLECIEPNNSNSGIESIWIDSESNLLTIYQYDDSSILVHSKDLSIITSTEEIVNRFIESYAHQIYEKSSGIEPAEEGPEVEELIQPYDPEQIRVETKNFSVYQVYELINEGDIDLSPDFQRNFVWKDISKKSRLIESILLRIPLPVFYLAQDKEGKFQVIDGLQRLTVIKDFIDNKFSLKKLEYLHECEYKYYSKKEALSPKYVRRVKQANLMLNIIDPQTPTKVKFEIFKRINEGGKPLKPQEIRNCMASTRTRNFIKAMTSSDEFLKATNNSVSSLRMEDQELILRFVAFYYAMYIKKEFDYKGWMNGYLDDMLDILNNASDFIFAEIKQAFLKSMRISFYLFGEYAFRKCKAEHLSPGARKQYINKSLFTTWSVLLTQVDEVAAMNKDFGSLVRPLVTRLEKDAQYFDALTSGTNDLKKLITSFDAAQEIIEASINHDRQN